MKKPDAIYSIFLLLLSIYVLVALAVEVSVDLHEDTIEILRYVDLAVCVVFLGDFFVRLFIAESKKEFLKWGWIDLISSIPSLDTLRWGRLARIVRIVRFLRGMKSISILIREFKRRKGESVFLLTIFTTILVFIYGSIGITTFERGLNSEIQSGTDALWWSILNILNSKVSISGVISEEAKILTLFLNRFGFVVFAVLNGLFIAWLVGPKEKKEDSN